MPSSLTNVFLVGGSGYTGLQVAKALVETGHYNVSALIRPSSLSKPATEQLRSLGVTIHSGDITTDDVEKLESLLSGMDILISMVLIFVDQRKLLLAAKKANVKRVVPSDFGPHIPPGVTRMHDEKLAIRHLIEEHSIPHTFIQVGWWANNMFPLPHDITRSFLPDAGKQFAGSGTVPVSWIDYSSVGKLIALIIADPRTLNQVVHAYDGEATLNETWALGTKITGEDFNDYPKITAEEIQRRKTISPINEALYSYYDVLYIRGDNTIANAVAAGVLDSHKLYPDYKPVTLEESAKLFYEAPPLFTYDI
ncbi:NAD(P)-binding protein [Flagelloscypha sp. PMI_526]|nr:NAD(P)-binding protein [Flagelloscypha sp. PMI_526]